MPDWVHKWLWELLDKKGYKPQPALCEFFNEIARKLK